MINVTQLVGSIKDFPTPHVTDLTEIVKSDFHENKGVWFVTETGKFAANNLTQLVKRYKLDDRKVYPTSYYALPLTDKSKLIGLPLLTVTYQNVLFVGLYKNGATLKELTNAIK